ncbi:MAG: hypothetical protein ACYTHJ_04095 [Planctomycetota bacterium]
MADKINRFKNPDFSLGKTAPKSWEFEAEHSTSQWSRLDTDDETGGIRLTCPKPGNAAVSQSMRIKPGDCYRFEADITCALSARDESSGLILQVEFQSGEDETEDVQVTTPVRCTNDTLTVRAFFEVPDYAKRGKFSTGILNAGGNATIERVRLIKILDPDFDAHPLAIPPPPLSYEPSRVAESVTVCSDTADERPLTELLRHHFGIDAVNAMPHAALRSNQVDSDAILFPDAGPPPAIKSMASLMALANERVVVISLPAFKKLAGNRVTVRTIRQDDDPVHAKIGFGCHATHGFALDDVFPYAWHDNGNDIFTQRQFRNSTTFKSFCKKHDLGVLLKSMCDKDATSDRPIALFKETKNGALYVIDLDPVEIRSSTMGETNLAIHLALALLGQTVTNLGQFVVPYESEGRLRGNLREMSHRFASAFTHDADVPDDEVTHQLITAGRDGDSFGIPLKPKPVIMIRSGLTAGDMESIYGALYWFKQLVRMPPFTCPYADELASRFRIAWLPCTAPFEPRYGLAGSGVASNVPMEINLENAEVAALIDVASAPVNHINVAVPEGGGAYERYGRVLPRLCDSFLGGGGLYHGPPEGEDFADRSSYRWHKQQMSVRVAQNESAFGTQAHQDVLNGGGQAIRIEVPGHAADFIGTSIHRTDIAATLLELVVGMQYGLIAVNRRRHVIQFDGFAPVAPGEALVVDDPALLEQAKAS